MGYE
ncbi:hypothetical protein VCHC55C2_3187A, partial [Vibrio cholerae HC-55C2]|jgi:hypothetical protein